MERHGLIYHKDVPTFPAKPDTINETTECSKLQWCVCKRGSPTSNAHLFHQRLVHLMKPSHVVRKKKGDQSKPKPTPQRILLDNGALILKLSPNEAVEQLAIADTPHATSWEAAAGVVTGVSHDQCLSQPVWLHMSHVNFQVWEISVVELEKSLTDVPHPQVSLNIGERLKVSTLNFFGGSMVLYSGRGCSCEYLHAHCS